MPENPTVLVVDDEEKLADMYSLWLRSDYDVRTANDARDAVGVLDESVDVVLLDRRMPGLSGDRLLDELPADRPFGVIMVSAVDPDFDIVDMEFDDYLPKPVQHDDLRAAIDHQVDALDRDRRLRQYLAARAKLGALEARKPSHVLAEHAAYDDLRSTADRLESGLRDSVPEFDDLVDGFAAIDRGS
ncbi:response regulator [Halostella litorea]|uniref:response regulator n=1 Tax=Halostella litorea TaxID=2528831 RepID=UPI001092199B|nr:response regulator [Halostella litorea]